MEVQLWQLKFARHLSCIKVSGLYGQLVVGAFIFNNHIFALALVFSQGPIWLLDSHHRVSLSVDGVVSLLRSPYGGL